MVCTSLRASLVLLQALLRIKTPKDFIEEAILILGICRSLTLPPGPRVIEIYPGINCRWYAPDDLYRDPAKNGVTIRKDTHTQLFNIERVCKESQQAVLWRYVKAPASKWGLTGLPDSSAILFDSHNDIIYYDREIILASREEDFRHGQAARELITTITIRIGSLDAAVHFGLKVFAGMLSLSDLTNLKTIIADLAEFQRPTRPANSGEAFLRTRTVHSDSFLAKTPNQNPKEILKKFRYGIEGDPELAYLKNVKVVFI